MPLFFTAKKICCEDRVQSNYAVIRTPCYSEVFKKILVHDLSVACKDEIPLFLYDFVVTNIHYTLLLALLRSKLSLLQLSLLS